MSEPIKAVRRQPISGRVEELSKILSEFAEFKLHQYNLTRFANISINITVPCEMKGGKHCSEHNDGYYCKDCIKVLEGGQ